MRSTECRDLPKPQTTNVQPAFQPKCSSHISIRLLHLPRLDPIPPKGGIAVYLDKYLVQDQGHFIKTINPSMDGHREYYDRESKISYDFTYLWDLKNNINR